jgi:phage-related minor tail protein
MAAVGAAAGIISHAMSGGGGGGGSSNNTRQGNSTLSNAAQQPGQSGVQVAGVQHHLATGGLVMGPTIALLGEAGREAVIPLDHPRAKQQMGDSGVGGGTHISIKVDGMISPDNLAKVVEQINKRVNKGQLRLQASSSHRLTKRSA